jgi:hypothetical protein
VTTAWWAAFLAALGGVVLSAGALTPGRRPAAAVALGLFAAAVVLMLVPAP